MKAAQDAEAIKIEDEDADDLEFDKAG